MSFFIGGKHCCRIKLLSVQIAQRSGPFFLYLAASLSSDALVKLHELFGLSVSNFHNIRS